MNWPGRYRKRVSEVMAPYWEARRAKGENPPNPDEVALHARVLDLAGRADGDIADLLEVLRGESKLRERAKELIEKLGGTPEP